MIKWEYKVVTINVSRYVGGDIQTSELEDALNKMGEHGWEAINVFDLNSSEGKSSTVVASLKRPVRDDEDDD